MEARLKEVTSEERYMVAITTYYAYIHLNASIARVNSKIYISSHIFWSKKYDQFCYVRLYLGIKPFHVVC